MTLAEQIARIISPWSWEDHSDEGCETGRDISLTKAEQAIAIVSDWQEISTAPKDYTEVLVYSPEHEGCDNQGVFLAWHEPEERRWLAYGSPRPILLTPTHWHHLPTPPEGSAS